MQIQDTTLYLDIKLKGLITMYGGSNSHMTIRCSELNVTAVIGLGHKGYNEIEIDVFFKSILR